MMRWSRILNAVYKHCTLRMEILKNVDEARLEGNVTIRHAYGGPVWQERLGPLSGPEQLEALQAAAMLAAQMQSLLQTFVLNREGPCRIGRLNTNALYKLHTCDTKLFHKNVEQRHLNTEIVIAVDMSDSMHLNDKDLMACFLEVNTISAPSISRSFRPTAAAVS